MRHKIFYLLLGLCAILTSCVQEEMESLGTIKSTVEPVLILPEQAILKVNTQAIKADGQVVITNAYAVPFDEEMHSGYDDEWNWSENYIHSDVRYTDDFNIGEIHFRSSSNYRLKPGEKYKLILTGRLINKDAKPAKDGWYAIWDDDKIINSDFRYNVPDFSFTTPKDIYEVSGIAGNSIFDFSSKVLQVLPTSALLDLRISANPGSNMKFITKGWNDDSYYDEYPGYLSVKCYLDPDLTKEDIDIYDYYNREENTLDISYLKPDTDYYLVFVSETPFYMAYNPEQYGHEFEFKFDEGIRFNKEPIKFHTPHDYYDTYYIVTGNGTSWDFNNAVQMSTSSSEYDSELTYYATVYNKQGKNWLIIPESTLSAWSLSGQKYYVPKVLNNQGGNISGEMVLNGSFSNMAVLDSQSYISIRFPEKTYIQTQFSDKFYVTGDGWSEWGKHWMPLVDVYGNLEYNGFVKIESLIKISPDASFENAFGSSTPPSLYTNDGIYVYNGSCNNGLNDISIDHSGFYFMTLYVNDWSYQLYGIKNIGIIGGFNNWNTDVAMTPSSDLWIWNAEVTMNAGSEFKFRLNNQWDVNLGGEYEKLITNGNNLICPEDGTYLITLDLSKYPSSCTMTKK